jgi:replicative DNA helicase
MNNFNQLSEIKRLPPQDIEAEKALLGSLMIDPNAIWKVIDFLGPDDFYKKEHQDIYAAMIDLANKNSPIDIKTLASRLQELANLEKIGGTIYLSELLNTVPNASNVFSYAKIVQKKRILRNLIEASYEIGELGYQEKEEVEQILDKAEKIIFQISQKGVLQKFLAIKDALAEAWERMEKLAENPSQKLSGLGTGFPKLDNILAGLHKSDLIILASRPSYGKSSLALNIARYVAVHEKQPVGIFSLEMSKEQVVDRLIASQSRVSLWKIRTGRLSKTGEFNDFSAINNALGVLSEAPIYIDDTSSPTVLQLKAMARRLQAEAGLGLIVVDYLQLIQPLNTRDSVVQQVTQISRGLKDLARELNVPVLALSQFSRAVEQRTPPIPRLADLRESGSLEQDSDVVIFIHRPDKYDQSAPPNVAEIIVAKHRNGPTGSFPLRFNEEIVTFETIAENLEEPHFEEDFNKELPTL